MSDYPTPTSVSNTPTNPTPPAAMSPVQEASPYQTPGSYAPAPSTPGDVSPTAISHLVRTRKWVRLCSIIGFIGSAFMILAGVIMMVGSTGAMRGTAFGAGFGVGMGLFY